MSVRKRVASTFAVLGAQLILHACIYYDSENRCGPNMVFNAEAHVCLCDEKSIKVAGACQRCAEGREPVADKCACPTGMKESDDGQCKAVAGLGDACDAAHSCDDAVYDYCALREDGTGTCTKRCTHDDDCDAAYTCADWEATPYCRQFAGVGTSCSMPGLGDSACGAEADYCFMGQCFVRQCTPTESHATDDCPRDRKCCDVSFLNLPGVMSACVAVDSTVCK